uniref:PPM-type phosphatase domain-containing protein n=1 Tax=Fagus sylvatica TaxID=28930 RepID=A0A2N9FJ90_FAGSY
MVGRPGALADRRDVARVNGQLAVSRAFGDKNLKTHLRSDPDVQNTEIDQDTDLLVLASDGLWKVMANQEAVDIARKTKDPQKAAKQLAAEALKRDSKDDISIVVVRFKGPDLVSLSLPSSHELQSEQIYQSSSNGADLHRGVHGTDQHLLASCVDLHSSLLMGLC